MRSHRNVGILSSLLFLTILSSGRLLQAQQTATASNAGSAVPHLVSFSGKATDAQGKTIAGTSGVTFAIYKDQTGGAPLWIETQTVTPDSKGNYSAQLGATKAEGLPLDLFANGEARWLGVKVNDADEQPRVLLLSVPYALKAADAETVGGLPASAFVLATAPVPTAANGPTTSSTTTNAAPPPAPITGSGALNFVPLWTGTTALGSSTLFQSGTGATSKVGINTITPAATLDVKGAAILRGVLTLPAIVPATATKGSTSQPLSMVASAFNSTSKAAANEYFNWQAEPAGNNTAAPSATLNLLFGSGATKPVETGLRIANNGLISFVAGQAFPGTGPGTITGLTAGTDLTGGGTSGSVTLNLDTTKVPQLKAANTFTGNQTVSGNVSATGTVTGSSFQIGSDLFGFGSHVNLVSFVGFAGSAASTGQFNTGAGAFALGSNTTGSDNTAVGADALFFNLVGADNTAVGFESLAYNTGSGLTAVGSQALEQNTVGVQSAAVGALALEANTTGSGNSAFGFAALASNTTGGGNTGIGWETLTFTTQGSGNTAIGSNSLTQNTTGGGNTGNGQRALTANTNGESNTASGLASLQGNTSGNENTAVGAFALEMNTTGTENTCIGYFCGTNAADLRNATAIGARAIVSISDSVVLGSVAGVNGTTETAKVGIGTTTPTAILTIGRGLGHPVSDSWETYSSRRWKTNIQTLPNALATVEKLRGVSYDQKDSGKHEIGVIAEEVGSVVPELVTYEANGKDARGVDYSRLTALLIEGMKQQQKEIQHERAVLRAQSAAIRNLKSELRETRLTLGKIQGQQAAQASLVAGSR